MYINIKIEYLIIRTGLTYGAGVVHLTLLSVDQLEVDLLQGRGHPLRAQVRAVREAGPLPPSSWAAVPDYLSWTNAVSREEVVSIWSAKYTRVIQQIS